ncbi:MAG: hypothetical protein IJ379_00330 [Lachnospiraceae bacterium]|nr:hypothetical protein [Lachnospiraceae bacterium]
MSQGTNNKNLTTDVTFEKVSYTGKRCLENQNGYTNDFTFDDVEAYLEEMFEDFDQFVTLELVEATHGIRFIQACRIDGGIDVELGLENATGTKLVARTCSEEECIAVFQKFYKYSMVDDLDDYKPMAFRV